MKKLFFFAVASIVLFACSKEDGAPEGKLQSSDGQNPVKFYASFENTPGSGTKVYSDEQLRLLWNAGDRISIFNKRTYNDQYEFDGDDGDNAGGFDLIPASGFFSGNQLDNIYAVYPYSEDTKINNAGDQITVILPAEQGYKEHSFGRGANTMVAATSDYFLAFKNVCGYLKFRLYGDNVSISSIKLEGNNGEKIAGKAFVVPAIGGSPAVTMDNTATRSITINCTDPVTIGTTSENPTEFIFVVPPTTFSRGFKVTVTDNTGRMFIKSSARSLTVSRNKMESMGAIKVIPEEYVVFDDENFEMYCIFNFDDNGDEKISPSEVANVETLELDTEDLGIVSLKGIEYFTSLVKLYCDNNNLTSLDLSSNTNLEVVSAQGNKLSSVNVTNNTKLKLLNLKTFSATDAHLTSLDVSNNPFLKSLIVDFQPLTELDVSNHDSLIVLQASDCTNLTSLNINNTPNLARLYLQNTGLERLDVSSSTSLVRLWLSGSENLTYVDCSGNQLTDFRVRSCGALKEINCENNNLQTLNVTDCPLLQYLFCDNNKLTSLDLSNNLYLLGLRASNNELTALDISNNPALEGVQFWGNKLTSWSGSANNTVLNTVRCDNNLLTSLDVSMLPALKLLYCDGNQLSSIDVSSNAKLTLLYCNDNNLTALNLSGNALLTDLICSNNSLTALDLSNNTKISDVRFSNNSISSIDMSFLTKLWLVECYGNNITTLDVSSSAGLTYLVAWPQSTLTTVRKKTSANVTYFYVVGEDWTSINPADYGTTIVNVD